MHFVRDVSSLRSERRPLVVTVGRFDGVHLGHQAVLGRLKDIARCYGAAAVVVNRLDPTVPTLGCLHQRIERFAAFGVEIVCLLRDRGRRQAENDATLIELLARGENLSALVLGSEHAAEIGHPQVEVETVPMASIDGTALRSAAIRSFVSTGDLGSALRLLGRPYSVGGRIVHGLRRGRQLGFPTANMRIVNLALPPNGVYAVRFRVDARTYEGVANLGMNPTFADVHRSLETHVFDFDADIYGRYAEVTFVDYLRGEQKFSGVEALIEQIRHDCVAARRRLS